MATHYICLAYYISPSPINASSTTTSIPVSTWLMKAACRRTDTTTMHLLLGSLSKGKVFEAFLTYSNPDIHSSVTSHLNL